MHAAGGNSSTAHKGLLLTHELCHIPLAQTELHLATMQELLVVFRRTAPRNWLSEVKAALLGDAFPAKPQLRRCAFDHAPIPTISHSSSQSNIQPISPAVSWVPTSTLRWQAHLRSIHLLPTA